jgi:sorbitol-specific phosphotransferase system component IIC
MFCMKTRSRLFGFVGAHRIKYFAAILTTCILKYNTLPCSTPFNLTVCRSINSNLFVAKGLYIITHGPASSVGPSPEGCPP